MVYSLPSSDWNQEDKFRYVRILVGDNLKGEIVGKKVKENISEESVAKTDNYTSYTRIKDHLWCHIPPRWVKRVDAGKILPWVHTIIANAKRTMLGVHHMVSKKYAKTTLMSSVTKEIADTLTSNYLID